MGPEIARARAMQPPDHFRYCPACGQRSEGEGSRVTFECGGCGFLYYFTPAIGAAGVVSRADGKVLVIRRSKDPGRGLLAFPGGFLGIGERAEEALRREILEEVGVEIERVRFLGSFTNLYFFRGVTYPVLDLFFAARAVDPERARALEEVQGLAWVDPRTELDPAELAFDSMRQALDLVLGRGSTVAGRVGSEEDGRWDGLAPHDMKYTYEELAKMIDHSLLHPTLTDQELEDGCRLAARYGVASVCVKPYAVVRAAELLRGTGVAVGCVIGFPHGNSSTEVKRYETERACREGAVEIDMVLNLGKALSGDWAYVEGDVKAVCDEAHRQGARVKVILENDYLVRGGVGEDGDAFKRRLCGLCERAGADWVKTSTGYGFVKQPDGSYNYRGATEHDLRLMRDACSSRVQVKAAGGVRDLDGLIRVRDLGASRCGATATAAMLDEYRRRAALEVTGAGGGSGVPPAGELGRGGY